MATLSDKIIKENISKGLLIENGLDTQVGPACYELRMGTVYYDLTESDKPISIKKGGFALIKPGHRVVLITQESLCIPDNIIARVTSKGSLFSIGLSPASTYADPGFIGNMGIVTQNTSDQYIKIPFGESIAKIDFSELTCPTTKPYTGQHGYQTEIWPIKHRLQINYEDIKNDPRVNSELEEAYKLLPLATAKVIRKIRTRQKQIYWGLFFAVIANTVAITCISQGAAPMLSIILNLASTAIVGIWVYLIDDKE